MKGSITLSCGHLAGSPYDGVPVRFASEDCIAGEGFVPAVTYAEYCPKCAEALKKDARYIATDEQEDAWLDRDEPR